MLWRRSNKDARSNIDGQPLQIRAFAAAFASGSELFAGSRRRTPKPNLFPLANTFPLAPDSQTTITTLSQTHAHQLFQPLQRRLHRFDKRLAAGFTFVSSFLLRVNADLCLCCFRAIRAYYHSRMHQ